MQPKSLCYGLLMPLAAATWMQWHVPAAHAQVWADRATPPTAASTELPRLHVARELYRPYETHGVTWSSDSKMLAAYSEWSDLITIWNVDGSIVKEIRRSGDHSITPSLAFVADNTEIASRPALNSSWDLAVSVFDITTGAVVHKLPVPKPGQPHAFASALASSPDESLLAVAYGGGVVQPVSLYSTKDWTKVADIPGPGPSDPHDKALAVAFSRDGRLLAIGSYQDVLIYDVASRHLIQRLNAFSYEDEGCCIRAIAFNGDASELAVASYSYPITVHLPSGPKRIVPKTPIKIFRLADLANLVSYPSPLWRVFHRLHRQ